MSDSKADQLRALRERNYNSPGKKEKPVKVEELKKIIENKPQPKTKKRGPYKKKKKK